MSPFSLVSPPHLNLDLHIEFGHLTSPLLTPSSPYLALIGDIGLAKRKTDQYRQFLLEQADRFEQVFVVPGNHEFYHSTVTEALAIMEEVCNLRPNLHCMLQKRVDLCEGNVVVLGTPLWCDSFLSFSLSFSLDRTNVPEERADIVRMRMTDYSRIFMANPPGSKDGLLLMT